MQKNEDSDYEFVEAVTAEDFLEVTASGHIFEKDDLIAL